MALPPANVGATEPAFAWTGQQFLVWGGIGYHTETGTCIPCAGGGIYDPKKNSWRAMSAVGAPTARDWAMGVWTGKYFVTWGGLPGYTPPLIEADQTGGIYELASDSWRAVSTDGQPAWRWQHVLAWSGREVLVWGGASPSNVRLCDGGRFDPETNTWRSMSLDGAPAGCVGTASVWSGSELVVWGGTKAGSEVELTNTGAAYNPETDSWRPISTAGAPTARNKPASVWTGHEMIVYGGNVGVDARAYDPVTDRWRSLSLKGAPGVHTGGDAVWTGSEMLLWGDPNCDVGGRYDLASDTWKPFSSKGVLIQRATPTLVWTGEAMIAYGGAKGIESLRDTTSGGLYWP